MGDQLGLKSLANRLENNPLQPDLDPFLVPPHGYVTILDDYFLSCSQKFY